jgi:hypothetical protein
MTSAKRSAASKGARKATKRGGRSQRTRTPPADMPGPADDLAQSGFAPLRLSNGTPVGFVFLDRAALEDALLQSLLASGVSKSKAAARASSLWDPMVTGLAHQIGRYLDIAVLTQPLMLHAYQVVAASDPDLLARYQDLLLEGLESVASSLESQSEGVLAELPGLPFARAVKRLVERNGSRARRQRLIKILGRVARGKAGRPPALVKERSDVRLVLTVDYMLDGIEPHFKKARERQQAARGRYQSDEVGKELERTGYSSVDIDILLSSRTAHAAAVKLTAHYLNMQPRTVASAVSRGRQYLRRTNPSRQVR